MDGDVGLEGVRLREERPPLLMENELGLAEKD